MREDEARADFNMEMGRFIPAKIKERTIDNPDYWAYVRLEVNEIASALFADNKPKNRLNMDF